MTGINAYSTTASENVAANTGITWDEGMNAGLVNNSARQNMADTRAAFNDLIWFQYGVGSKTVPAVYASGTSITLAGTDATAAWEAGRRVRAVGSSTGTIYGKVASSAFASSTTTVNFTWDSGSLSNETLAVYLCQIPVTGASTGTNKVVLSDSPTLTGSISLGSGGTGSGTFYPVINGPGASGANFGLQLQANSSNVGAFYYDVNSGQIRISAGSKDPAITVAGNTGNLAFTAYGAGTLTTDSSGNVTASSDASLKTIEGPYSRGLADILKIDTVQWRWNKESGLDGSALMSSYTAQGVQAGVPEAVFTGPNGKLTVFDGAIIAALINAVKELAAR